MVDCSYLSKFQFSRIGWKIFFNKINSELGEKLQLPLRGIKIDDLAHFASAGALGLLTPRQIYSNEYLNNNSNKINLH